jgi:hypothetical protein
VEYPDADWSWWHLVYYYEKQVPIILRNNKTLPWKWKDIIRKIENWEILLDILPDDCFTSLIRIKRNIPPEIIEKYIDKPWDFKELSCNTNVSMKLIEKYPDKDWDWNYLSSFGCITFDFIQNHDDKPFNWISISKRTVLDWSFVFKFQDKPWSKKTLSTRHDLKPEYIVQYPHLWNYRALAKNPIITKEFVEKNWKLPWKGKYSEVRRECAAKIIQKMWLDAYYSPYTVIGKKRLLREFDELTASN